MSDIIYHRHHIIPRHAGGTDDPSNIVELTIEEHAEAHRLLYEEHGRWEDKVAWLGLAGLIGKDELLLEIAQNREYSKETREKIGAAHRGKKLSPEHIKALQGGKEKRIAKLRGRKLSEEHKAKLSEAGKCRKQSAETIAKRKKSMESIITSEEYKAKLRAANTGKKHTDEAKAKISKANKGRKHTDEAKAKMKESQRDKTLSEEHKAKISAALKGKKKGPLSEEAKANMSAAQKRYWEKKRTQNLE